MKTLRKLDPVNKRFLKDLSDFDGDGGHEYADDFIVNLGRHQKAVVSLRSRHAVVNGYVNGPKTNVFHQVYHLNPATEVVMFLRTPVRFSDHLRRRISDSELAGGYAGRKHVLFEFHSFDHETIAKDEHEELAGYMEDLQKTVEADS